MSSLFITILQCLFWFSLAGLFHTYVLYPAIMFFVGRNLENDRPRFDEEDEAGDWPEVSVVMAMYNEAPVIERTVESILNSDYPAEKFELVIGSDNSDDGSNELVEAISRDHSNVKLKVFKGRNGKIKIINDLVEALPEVESSVVLLCDANVTWTPELLRRAVRHFKDPSIGIVATNVLDSNGAGKGISEQEETYVNQENRVKFAEGVLWGRMMGAFGACYALRRTVFERIPDHFNVDDFYQTMAGYENRYDGIVDLGAICFEAVSEEITEEFRRKKRISKGNFQNFQRFSSFLLPWNAGFPTFFAFWSHKGLRWFGPLLIITLLISAPLLAGLTFGWWFGLVASGLLGSILMAGADKVMESVGSPVRFRLFKFARYFYAMNLALLLGGIEYIRGVQTSVWEPTKRLEKGKTTVPVGE